jgi:hypothetical protein
MELIQDDESGIILQTTVRGHIIRIDPELISSIVAVPVLDIAGVPFTDGMGPPSMDDLMDFFDAHPQGDERAHQHIKISAFSSPHRLLVEIVLHNLWPTARLIELVLKRVRFLYALLMKMAFCLCKHIVHTMLEMRDDHSTSVPFACLVTKICLLFVTNITDAEPKVRV